MESKVFVVTEEWKERKSFWKRFPCRGEMWVVQVWKRDLHPFLDPLSFFVWQTLYSLPRRHKASGRMSFSNCKQNAFSALIANSRLPYQSQRGTGFAGQRLRKSVLSQLLWSHVSRLRQTLVAAKRTRMQTLPKEIVLSCRPWNLQLYIYLWVPHAEANFRRWEQESLFFLTSEPCTQCMIRTQKIIMQYKSS